MQLIGFRHQSTAYLLANYLQRQHISVRVSFDNEHGHVLHLNDERQLDQAKQVVADFLKNPNDSKYQDAAWQQEEAVKTDSTALARFNLASLRDVPVVALILVICSVIYIASLMGAFPAVQQFLMIQSLPELSESNQWWRIFTPAIIHFSELHIIFNLLWWWVLGRQVENRFGSVFLLVFLLITAGFSNLAQLVVSGPNFGGLSGVVYALMGFVWWVGWLKPQWGINLPKPLVGFMLVWLVIGYADVLWVSMANTAHTAGLISGCILAVLMVSLSDKWTDRKT